MIANCERCGKPFNSKKIEWAGVFEKFCKDCEYRNLFDAMSEELGTKTPPCFLDKHTLNPALSDREFQKSLRHES